MNDGRKCCISSGTEYLPVKNPVRRGKTKEKGKKLRQSNQPEKEKAAVRRKQSSNRVGEERSYSNDGERHWRRENVSWVHEKEIYKTKNSPPIWNWGSK